MSGVERPLLRILRCWPLRPDLAGRRPLARTGTGTAPAIPRSARLRGHHWPQCRGNGPCSRVL